MAWRGTATDRRRRRTAGVIIASALVHGLLLLVIGAHVPRADWRMHGLDQSVIQVELTRPLPPPPPPKPPEPPRPPEPKQHPEAPKPPEPAARPEPAKPAPTPARKPEEEKQKPLPQTPAPAVVPPRPTAPAPAATAAPSTPAPAATAAPGRPSPWLVAPGSTLPPGFSTSLRTHVGCSDPHAAGLSRQEREACKNRLAEGARDAPFIQAPMAPDKRAAYDRVVRCRRDYNDAPVPNNAGGWGLGYIPRLRDCGPGDH